MEFIFAYTEMLQGKKVARPCFKGYWYIDGVTNKLTIHMASGEEITEGCLDHTVKNTLADDWEIVE